MTTTVVPVDEPGFHVYDEAPVTVNEEVFPGQTLEEDAVRVNVGLVPKLTGTLSIWKI